MLMLQIQTNKNMSSKFPAVDREVQVFPLEKKLQSTLTKVAETNGCNSTHKD